MHVSHRPNLQVLAFFGAAILVSLIRTSPTNPIAHPIVHQESQSTHITNDDTGYDNNNEASKSSVRPLSEKQGKEGLAFARQRVDSSAGLSNSSTRNPAPIAIQTDDDEMRRRKTEIKGDDGPEVVLSGSAPSPVDDLSESEEGKEDEGRDVGYSEPALSGNHNASVSVADTYTHWIFHSNGTRWQVILCTTPTIPSFLQSLHLQNHCLMRINIKNDNSHMVVIRFMLMAVLGFHLGSFSAAV